MKRLIILVCYASLISCQDKVICPAFQSTYILDDSTRNAYFSYVWQLDESTRAQYLAQQKGQSSEDTLGVVAQPRTDYYAYAGEKVVPWRVQKKSKYGIIKPAWYPIKNYQLRTAPMENVLAPDPVSNDFVASDFSDSLGVDSLSIASDSLGTQPAEEVVAKEETKYLYGYDPSDKFNVEQQYYNKYYAYKFIDNRPKPTPAPVDSLGSAVPDSLQTKEPFFKGLFKKKNKETSSSESEETTQPEVEGTTEEGSEENPEEGNG
ncbi:hypothetical protein SAMN05421640_1190 [Ekhidna lutea]|uniref:Uncharacterized protein n=1 Tax=Ekhidna lutea TaxID=447679 RepID=A0A239HBF6_EKHLU|nr:hypothetical protein [Ekhidna lutea]SNS77594.1 hypothetical protein SAMN05421640_1190 [Ekhidna lutea]